MNCKLVLFTIISALVAAIFLCCIEFLTPASTKKLLFACSFDSRETLLTPEVGPMGTIFSKGDLKFVQGVTDKALCVPAGGPLVTYNFKPSFLGGKGCVEFWAKILNDRPDYGCVDPGFYCIKYEKGEENLIQFTANNGAACSGLYGRMIHNERVTHKGWGGRLKYAEILPNDPKNWHHYAIVWNVDGVTGYRNEKGECVQAVLYVDGKPHMDHNLMRGKDNADMLLRTAAQSSVLGFPITGGRSNSSYLIDDFKI